VVGDFDQGRGRLVKTKQRIADHGEVFTPPDIVSAMLDLVKAQSERIDARFLEPACGEGNFLKQVLVRKLNTVQKRYSKNEFERRHYALVALMSIYGIELLEDNIKLCRDGMATIFMRYIDDSADTLWIRAAQKVLEINIVQADALTMKKNSGDPITFPEWGYLGKGKFQRRDFKYDNLTRRSSFAETLFDALETHDIFVPQENYRPMTVVEIADDEVVRCFS